MRKMGVIIVLLVAGIMLVRPVLVSAHGKDPRVVTIDSQMKRLHAIMPMFSLASAALETALEKGDITAVEEEAEKIVAAIPDLKKSKPHKNIKQRKKFVAFAAKLEETITSTVALAKQGDFAGAKAAFKNAEKTCAACHAKFRD